MKILCLCSAGNSRSVGTRFVLNSLGKGYDVLAAGVDHNTPETIAHLSAWADKILLAEDWSDRIPEEQRGKIIKEFTLGHDRWANPLSEDLHGVVRELLVKINL